MTKNDTKSLNKLHPRWLLVRDIPAVAETEKVCFSNPWTPKDFEKCLQRKHCNGLVIESGKKIVAYLIYEARRKNIQILNIAVRPDHRRQGLATSIVKKLVHFMMDNNYSSVVIGIRETNLNAQLFFRSCGFLATAVVRRHFKDTCEDLYQLEFDLTSHKTPQQSKESVPVKG